MKSALLRLKMKSPGRAREWAAQADPVAPAPLSDTVLRKYRTHRTADGFPVHSFPTLLADLGTIVKNRVILKGVAEAPGFDQVTVPT